MDESYLPGLWAKSVTIFSSPELKAQVSYSDQNLSIIVVLVVNIFCRTTGPIKTKLGTKYPWVERIQISSPEPQGQFQPNLALGGDNYVIAKIH